MRIYHVILMCAALCGASCTHHHESSEHKEEHAHAHRPGEIVVEHEVAEQFGLESDTLRPGEFSNVYRVAATVLPSTSVDGVVSSPTRGIVSLAPGIEPGCKVSRGQLIAIVNSNAISGGNPDNSGKAILDAARKEYNRIESLYKEQLATLGELNAAEAALRAAEAAYSPVAATGRAISAVGGTLTSLGVKQGQFVEAGQPLANVSSQSRLTLRFDLPARYADRSSAISDARIVLPYGNGETVTVSETGGKRISGEALPAGASAYVPVFFSVPGGHGLRPGAVLTAYLIGTPRTGVLSVPVDALSEQQGLFYVYERIGDHSYAKRAVDVLSTDGLRAEISGVDAGTVLVMHGASTVRMAENSGKVPEGHSHNH